MKEGKWRDENRERNRRKRCCLPTPPNGKKKTRGVKKVRWGAFFVCPIKRKKGMGNPHMVNREKDRVGVFSNMENK